MSEWRTNRQTGSRFKTQPDVQPSREQRIENQRVFVELVRSMRRNKGDQNAFLAGANILLVRDGLKPAGFVKLDVDSTKLLSLLKQLGLKHKVNVPENIVYFARTEEDLLRLIRANDLGTGDIGSALGFPSSAIRWFNARNDNPAVREVTKNFPYMPRIEFVNDEEGHEYNVLRAKAFEQATAEFEREHPQAQGTVFFVYEVGDKKAEAIHNAWTRYLDENYGIDQL